MSRIIKIPILLALMLLAFSVYSLFFGFLDTANAPFVSSSDYHPAEQGASDTHPADIVSDTPIAPGYPVSQVSMPSNDDFVTVRMDNSDIFRGNLLLINHNYRFEIPFELDLAAIADYKTPSYRVTDSDILLSRIAIGCLNDMMDAFFAETGSSNITIISAFRGYERQQGILNDYIALVGYNQARRWAALPGHSEHHAGLAVDLGVYSNGALRTFRSTGVNAWFRQNSYNYGFILRFTHEKFEITRTEYEPWHFRYVGLPHSYIIQQNGWCLEEYIEFIMWHTREEPFRAVLGGDAYEIYFTRDTEIRIPFRPGVRHFRQQF
jgi:LAS superfamily LD-carboxypeptidase LdcB